MATNKVITTGLGLGVIGGAITAVYLLAIRPWHMKWGTTIDEVERALPGDELIAHPKQISTRAITIHAPAARIWPWLVQLGQERGGFYSYEELENLAGCDIHNADRIIPEFQHLAAGDRVRLGPEGFPFFTVADFEPNRVLILRAGDPQDKNLPLEESWVFYLAEIDPDTTRLIVRSRRDYAPTVANIITWRVITEPLHFMMEQKMLRGIKARAEAASG